MRRQNTLCRLDLSRGMIWICFIFGIILFSIPYLSELDFGIFQIPAFNSKFIQISKWLGPIPLSLVLLSLFPCWKIESNEVDIEPEIELLELPDEKKEVIKIAFLNEFEIDPASLEQSYELLSAGHNKVSIKFSKSSYQLFENFSFIANSLINHKYSTSIFYNTDPGEITDHLDRLQAIDSLNKSIIKGAKTRIPILWESIKDYSYAKTTINNFLLFTNMEICSRIIHYINYRWPKKTSLIPDTYKAYICDSPDDREIRSLWLSKLFNISEPIYSVEIYEISSFRYCDYILGPKSSILELNRHSKNTITNGLFSNFIIPQIEIHLASLNSAQQIPYCEEAVIDKIKDENGNRLGPH